MFTGIVEEMGEVLAVERAGAGAHVRIAASVVLGDITVGASVAVNGCCLTATEFGPDWWVADAVPETLERTNVGDLAPGHAVNLERPLAADGRYGGHIVQGHVDGVGTVVDRADLDDGSRRYTFAIPPPLAPYVVEKGSIALDGVSLTVASVTDTRIEVALIPHTLAVTTLGQRGIGDTVNIETDIMGKYVERLLQTGRVDVSAPLATPGALG